MKKLLMGVMCAFFLAFSPSANAFDLKDALKGLAGAASSSDDSDGSGQDLLGGLLSGLLSSDKISVKDMAGEWKYTGPSVSFKSENFLMKAGGAAASATVESKLEPYFKKVGLDNMTFTIYPDSTFTMQIKRTAMKGVISTDVPKGSQANFTFTFQVLGISMGKMDTYVTKSGNNLSLMFDVTKLVAILQKIATLSGNSTISGVSSILDNYDGICAGFKLSYVGQPAAKQ